MPGMRIGGRAFALVLGAVLIAATHLPPARAGDIPKFEVDASWPKPLPNNWVLGQVGGITTDKDGHIWVLQRPRTLTDDEKGAALTPPRSKCCVPAPPVLEFDADGNLLRSWGGPGSGYTWVGNEHGIEVDDSGFVWITGNAPTDGVVLKFTTDGKYVGQIGTVGPIKGSNDTTALGRPAETFVDEAAREIYIADGYANRRVIVFNADTLAFKRYWGAYGHKPNDDKQQPYDPLRDFDGVAVIGASPLVLAVPAGQGVHSLADLQKLARSTPGGINFGSPGKGSPAHLLTSALVEKLGVPGTHVPFVGEGAGLTALMGQQIHAMTLVIGTAAAQVKAGKLVPLALFGAQRSPLLPDVPTIAEALPAASDLARPAWIAVVAKAGTPPELLNRLNAVTEKCRAGDAHYKSRLEAMNVTLAPSAPGDARTWAARDAAVWRPLIDKLGLATE